MTNLKANNSFNYRSVAESDTAAAVIIQRWWRASNNQAKEQSGLNTETRWDDALANATLEVKRDGALDNRNSARRRWKRAVFLIGRMHDKDVILADQGIHIDSTTGLECKQLETQHWLEMIDRKHRYGSNLKVLYWYHQYWQDDETARDNFFHWLDYGAGKKIDLTQCPRDRLESEQIKWVPDIKKSPKFILQLQFAPRYLSAEQRLNYLVNITRDGRLVWAKDGVPVDTTTEGYGFVPTKIPAGGELTQMRQNNMHSGTQPTVHRRSIAVRCMLTLQRWMDRLLRRNNWMYISDRNFNIFVGIKETGKFQHSSFLAGGMVTSAGLIKVKKGQIRSLSPLSGHYRTSVGHFRQFCEVLQERGVDMSRVRIGKEETILKGVENLAKAKKKRGQITTVMARCLKRNG